MNKKYEELLQKVREFRHEYAKFQIYGNIEAGEATVSKLMSLSNDMLLMAEQVRIELKHAIKPERNTKLLDELLHLDGK